MLDSPFGQGSHFGEIVKEEFVAHHKHEHAGGGRADGAAAASVFGTVADTEASLSDAPAQDLGVLEVQRVHSHEGGVESEVDAIVSSLGGAYLPGQASVE